MHAELWSLGAAALSIGCLHTLFGPDHYVPFVAMSRAGGWSRRKTLWITALCGVGHVAGSVLLGLVGIALGVALSQLEGIEETRGGIAAWLLIGFGLAYLAWGIVNAVRGRPHSHAHVHADGTVHTHPHQHHAEHLHAHEEHTARRRARMAPWILFTIFLFGPCEPLIPLLMYPAAQASMWGLIVVTALFALATVGTMLVTVRLLVSGFTFIRFATFERYSHAIAGCLVLACGLAVKFGL